MDRRIFAAAAAVVLVGLGRTSHATPYASGVSETAGVVTFTLNESADDVIVIRDGTPTSLGALGRGSATFNRSGATNYSIVANKLFTPGYLLANGSTIALGNGSVSGGTITSNTSTSLKISDDSLETLNFFAPRGVAVNQNPASPTFGRIFVSNSNTGTPAGFVLRPCSEGIYIMNADYTDALGQGTVGFTAG